MNKNINKFQLKESTIAYINKNTTRKIEKTDSKLVVYLKALNFLFVSSKDESAEHFIKTFVVYGKGGKARTIQAPKDDAVSVKYSVYAEIITKMTSGMKVIDVYRPSMTEQEKESVFGANVFRDFKRQFADTHRNAVKNLMVSMRFNDAQAMADKFSDKHAIFVGNSYQERLTSYYNLRVIVDAAGEEYVKSLNVNVKNGFGSGKDIKKGYTGVVIKGGFRNKLGLDSSALTNYDYLSRFVHRNNPMVNFKKDAAALSHGFEPEKNIQTNAHVHQNATYIMGADISKFFPNVNRKNLLTGWYSFILFVFENILDCVDEHQLSQIKLTLGQNLYNALILYKDAKDSLMSIKEKNLTKDMLQGMFKVTQNGNLKVSSSAALHPTFRQIVVKNTALKKEVNEKLVKLSRIIKRPLKQMSMSKVLKVGVTKQYYQGLPTGLPTSPVLANLSMYKLDWILNNQINYFPIGINYISKVDGTKKAVGLVAKRVYTRYADDITVSVSFTKSDKEALEKAFKEAKYGVYVDYFQNKVDFNAYGFGVTKLKDVLVPIFTSHQIKSSATIERICLEESQKLISVILAKNGIVSNTDKARIMHRKDIGLSITGVKLNNTKSNKNKDGLTSGSKHKKLVKSLFVMLMLSDNLTMNERYEMVGQLNGNIGFIKMISNDGYNNMVQWMVQKASKYGHKLNSKNVESQLYKLFIDSNEK